MLNTKPAAVQAVPPTVPSGRKWALHAAALGWRVFPIVPGRGIPFAAGATNEALGLPAEAPAGCHHGTTDPERVRSLWSGERAEAWIGIATGQGVLALDLDEKGGKSGSASIAASAWAIPATASQRTKSGGSHYLFQVLPGTHAPTDASAIGEGIDRRGEGGYVVLYDPAILTASRATAPDWATACAARSNDRLDAANAVRAERYDVALDALRSRDPAEMERGEWLAFSGSFYTATVGLVDDAQSLADWQAWNAAHGETNEPAANARTWENFKRGSTSGDFRTLARMAGPDDCAKAYLSFGWDGPPAVQRPANDDARALFVRMADMVARPPQFLIDGILEEDALAAVFGDPAAGKSLVTIDVAGCVSTGETYHGHAVRQGAVFYIAGEGNSGLRRRFGAWECLHGQSLADAPLFASQAAIQLLDAASGVRLIAAIDALALDYGQPRLIVVDTLNRNFGPGDENSTADMSAFVAALDRLRERFPGCTVLVVHHSGHSDKDRARGSSVLRAALDSEYKVAKSGETVTLTNHKMKDAPPPRPMRFHLVEAAGSVALEYAGEADQRGGPLSTGPQKALDAFRAVAVDGSTNIETWRAAFYDRHQSENTGTKRKAFDRAREKLTGSYVLTDDGGENYRTRLMPGTMTDP